MTAGASIEIVSGLTAGDPVVTRGGFALKPGVKVVASGQGV
jgi:preprotein translocase subunit YajC